MYTSRIQDDQIDELFKAMLTLKTIEEYYMFFDDIATISEIQALSHRLRVAKLLDHNETYIHIEKETGASTATISRISKYLHYGSNGYRIVLDRLKEKTSPKDET